MVIHALQPGQDDLHVDLTFSALIYSPKTSAATTKPDAAATRTSVPSTMSSGTPGRGTVSPEPAVDPKAEEALMARRQADLEKAAKAEAEREAFNKLSEPEKEAWLQQRRLENEAAATQKAADDAAKQKQMELEMEKRRQQEQGGASPARGGVR